MAENDKGDADSHIAVVILSPEFVVRKWKLKDLMRFLEQFREGGVKEIM